jgi:hypothetical protein
MKIYEDYCHDEFDLPRVAGETKSGSGCSRSSSLLAWSPSLLSLLLSLAYLLAEGRLVDSLVRQQRQMSTPDAPATTTMATTTSTIMPMVKHSALARRVNQRLEMFDVVARP